MSTAEYTVLLHLCRSKTVAILQAKTESTQLVELSGKNITSDRLVLTDL